MIKNWMMLGDEAFNSKHNPIGVIRFSPEEMDNWQQVAWNTFVDVVNNNEKVKEMVFGCNYLYVSGLFDQKAGVGFDDLYGLSQYMSEQLDNIEYSRTRIDYYSSSDSNMLCLVFANYDPEEEEKRCLSSTMYITSNTIIPLNMQQSHIYS
jgi:hypothetical protein